MDKTGLFIKTRDAETKQKLKDLSEILFVQAQLIEGILPDDPADYVEKTLSMLS